MQKRGQASTEMIIILAMAVMILGGIIAYSQGSLSTINVQFEEKKARNAIDDIANSAELVYQQGSGAKTRVYTSIPRDLLSTTVSGNNLEMIFTNGNSVVRSLAFNVTGYIPNSEGNYWIDIAAYDNIVKIGNITAPVINVTCGDGVCSAGENCPADVGSCTDNVCYNPTCTNGCGQTAIINAVDAGECDASTVTGTCVDAPCICNALSICIDVPANVTVSNYLDLWELYIDLPYPLDFSSGLNYSANTFWPIYANDGWDWKASYNTGKPSTYPECATFNSATVATQDQIEIYIGDKDNCDGAINAGQGSGAYGIKFYVNNDQYTSLSNGSKIANLSFLYGYTAGTGELDVNEDIWIKVTLGNGSLFATETFESRIFGTGNTKWQGGAGWLYDWYRAPGNADSDVLNDAVKSGNYAMRLEDGNNYVDRALDLSTATNPRISFWARADSLESGEYGYFSISPDDATYTILESWTNGDEDDSIWRQYDFDLTPYFENSSEFWIAFETSGFNQANDELYIDTIRIYEGSVNFLGSALDSGSQADLTNEIYWITNPGTSTSGSTTMNVTSYFNGPGWYYLTFGARVYKWDGGEWANFYFDNISLELQ